MSEKSFELSRKAWKIFFITSLVPLFSSLRSIFESDNQKGQPLPLTFFQPLGKKLDACPRLGNLYKVKGRKEERCPFLEESAGIRLFWFY